MTISLIVAMDRNGVIGDSKTNDMPWGRSIPKDLRFFRSQTMGHVIVYGKKTFESMGSKPLPFRTNIVLTHHHFNIPTTFPTAAFTISSVDEVLKYHDNHLHKDRKMIICGGAGIYKEFIPYADEIIVTHIDYEFNGDIHFPLSQSELDFQYNFSKIITEVPVNHSNPYRLTMKKYSRL